MGNSVLFAAVVNRNSGADLSDCVAQLSRFLPPERIVVVDCGSTDRSLSRLRKGAATVIELGENRGYAGGNNAALRYIGKQGGTVALIVNPDARIDAHNAGLLVEPLQDHREIAAAFPLVRDIEHHKRVVPSFGFFNYRHRLVRMATTKEQEALRGNAMVDVDFGYGCCFALRVSAAEKVGLFDETFFAYHDEPDLCYRLREAGCRTVLITGSSAYHREKKEKSSSAAKEYFVCRNSVLFVKKHGSGVKKLKFHLFLLAGTLFYAILALVGDRAGLYRLRGYFDALRGRAIRKEILEII